MDPSSIYVIILILLTLAAAKLLNWLWLRPRSLERFLRNQGLRGNPYRFPLGDLGDLISVFRHHQSVTIQITDDPAAHSFAYYFRHRIKYGENSFIWFGPYPALLITDPQLMREIMVRTDVFQKKRPDPIGETVTGGLLYLEDEKWAKHRRIVAPAFYAERLKGMAPTMRLSCMAMVEKWEALFDGGGDGPREVDVWPLLQDLTGDVISRTAFGSSHREGRRIFELQSELVKLVLDILQFNFIPGWRYVPTKTNLRINTITKEIRTLLRGIVSQREKAMERGEAAGEDLLGMLMESNLVEKNKKNEGGLSIEDVIEECNLFYFAGSETTSSLLVWTMVMLSFHQEWQARAREEVMQVFGVNELTFDALNRLKIVTMILYEVMRLYVPVPVLARSPTKAVKLGNMTLPAGVELLLVAGLLHNDPKIWGDDAKEFKPERFSKGIVNASASKSPFAYVPFSSGPRVCIGQHYAMAEAKTAVAMILQRYRLELSPNYLHAPFSILTLQPQNGAPLLLHRL